MSTCQWCGDKHGVDRLCQRAQRAITRRSFCFLFGVGIAGAILPNTPRSIVIMDWPHDFAVRSVTQNASTVPIVYGYGNITGILHGHEVVLSADEAKAFFASNGVRYSREPNWFRLPWS